MVSQRRNIGVFAFVIFLISPLISLPFIFFSIYNRERFGLFVLALFAGVLSYSIIPSWELDLSRYYLLYEEIKSDGFQGFRHVVAESNDYLFFFIYYLFSVLKFEFQFVLFFLSTFVFYTSFWVFDNLIKKYKPSRGVYFLLITSFIMSLPVLSLASVTRFSLGYTFFILFVYHKLQGNNRSSIIFLVISCLTHFAYLVYIPFVALFMVFKNRIRINLMLIAIISIVFGLNILGGILDYADYIPFISDKIVTYVTIYEDTTLPILSYSLVIPVIVAIVYYFIYSQHLSSSVMQVFLVALAVVLLTIPFNLIIYDRYIQVFKPIAVIAIMCTFFNLYGKLHKKRLLNIIVLFLYIPFLLYYLYAFYVVYSESLKNFVSVGKLLLVSIFSSNYTHLDFTD